MELVDECGETLHVAGSGCLGPISGLFLEEEAGTFEKVLAVG